MTADWRAAEAIRETCPKCSGRADRLLFGRDDGKVHLVCGNADCRNEWTANV
jgi:hypothetical protein